MSKKSPKHKQGNKANAHMFSFAAIPPKKVLRLLLYFVTVILLLAIVVTSYLSAQSNGCEVFYANKSLVICDTIGHRHYIGVGNEVSIVNNSSLITNKDTIEASDSIISLLRNNYLDDLPVKENFLIKKVIPNKDLIDTIIVAEVKQDLMLRSLDKHNVLYVKGKERFLVYDTLEFKDSVCLYFNDIIFKAVTKDFTFDSISVAELNGNPDILEPFELLFAIWDREHGQLAVEMKSLESSAVLTDSLKDNNVLSLYYVNKDSLLEKVKRTDTTYVFNTVSRVDTTDFIELRVAAPKHLSIVVSAQEAVNILIPKDDEFHKSSSCHIVLLFILLSALNLLLICIAIHCYFTKRMTNNSDKDQRIEELEEIIQRLEKEIEELNDSSLTIPDDSNDYEDWFETLNPQEGNSGYYEICKEYLDKWRKAFHDQSGDDDFYLSKFQEYIELYIQTIPISVDSLSVIKTKTVELKQFRAELVGLTSESENDDDHADDHAKELEELKNLVSSLESEISSLESKNENLICELASCEEKFARFRQSVNDEIKRAKEKAKSECEERVRKAEDKARKDIDEANERTRKAKERAEEAERRAREIREEVTNQFKAEIQNLKEDLKNKQNTINKTIQALNQTNGQLKAKEQECINLYRDLQNKIEALSVYSERIKDVQPAGAYAKTVLKLLQIGHNVEKTADKLLEKSIDDYLLTKYITRYQKALHQLDMDQFATDVLNIANVQFVYKQQPLAKYDQYDVKKFRESMKLFFFESYLGKYIDALMVFNETMAGLHHLVDGLTESDVKVFEQYRKELNSVFKELEIEVHSVKIFDSITDNVDLSVKMRPLDFDCPSGTICQIDSCLVYLSGGNKPSDKIHVIVKE